MDIPKEERLDFDEEIANLMNQLESKYPGVCSDINFKIFKRMIIAKVTAEWFDRIAGQTGQGGTCQKPGDPVLKIGDDK